MQRYAWLAVVLAACSVEAESKPASPPDATRAIQERMHARFAEMQRIQRGIVTNKLAEVHTAAQSIATLDEPNAPTLWQPYLAAVRVSARELEAANDIHTAAQRAGLLGMQCGRCHEATGGTVKFAGEPRPEGTGGTPNAMASHQWAVAQMWQGLIGPSEERWAAGATALTKAPLTIVAENRKLAVADDVMSIRMLARRADQVQGEGERAQLYGDLLGSCTACHSTIRD